MSNLEKQVAVVTGAGKGIGKAISLKLASLGASIALIGRNIDNLNVVKSQIEESGAKAKCYSVDVRNSENINETVDQVLTDFGQIDILVNNAGVTRDGLFMRMKDEDWDMVLDTNLKGAFYFSRAVVRPMMKKRSGCIINISSIIGLTGNAGQANYSASKSGLFGLTKSLAKEVASRGIRVNALAPGFIQTEMTDELNDKIKEQLKSEIPLGYFGQPEDIAGVVGFLSSSESRYITGQVLTVDGGLVM